MNDQPYVGIYEGCNRTMVKISDSDCLLEETWADGALGSATGRVDVEEASPRPSSSSCFSFILMASVGNFDQDVASG